MALLSAYNHNASLENLKATLYDLHYVHSTPDLGITLSSKEINEPHNQTNNPFPHNKEAYTEASSPTLSSQHALAAYSYAFWVSHMESATKEGIDLEMFKYC